MFNFAQLLLKKLVTTGDDLIISDSSIHIELTGFDLAGQVVATTLHLVLRSEKLICFRVIDQLGRVEVIYILF